MAVQPTALARARAYTLSPVAFARVAFATVAMLWLIVATGAAVRLTGSGLGCRHWPGCEPGHPLPARDYHAFIEFGNRLVGGVTIALTVALWLAARRTPGLPRWTVRLHVAVYAHAAAVAVLGCAFLFSLGYLAARRDRSPRLFGFAVAILALLLVQ